MFYFYRKYCTRLLPGIIIFRIELFAIKYRLSIIKKHPEKNPRFLTIFFTFYILYNCSLYITVQRSSAVHRYMMFDLFLFSFFLKIRCSYQNNHTVYYVYIYIQGRKPDYRWQRIKYYIIAAFLTPVLAICLRRRRPIIIGRGTVYVGRRDTNFISFRICTFRYYTTAAVHYTHTHTHTPVTKSSVTLAKHLASLKPRCIQ